MNKSTGVPAAPGSQVYAQPMPGPTPTESWSEGDLHFNQWALIIYRPEAPGGIDDIRCYLRLEDAESGQDVTFTKAKAKYEWVANTINVEKKNPKSLSSLFKPDRITTLYNYKKKFFLSGGMAMHLNLKSGKYKITVTTPPADNEYFTCDNHEEWTSNTFYYDTENPAKVIFVYPTTNDNGFYNGGWIIDYKTR